MKFEDALIKEELNFKTEDKALDKIFRNTLELVYSKNYLKKIDDVFDKNIKIKKFKKTYRRYSK